MRRSESNIGLKPLTEKETKQLRRLLARFANSRDTDGKSSYFTAGEGQVLSIVQKWIEWYGADVLSIDV